MGNGQLWDTVRFFCQHKAVRTISGLPVSFFFRWKKHPTCILQGVHIKGDVPAAAFSHDAAAARARLADTLGERP